MSDKPRYVDGTTFQRQIGTIIDEAHSGGAVIVTSHGRPRVAVIGAKEYEELIEARRQLSWTRLAHMVNPAPAEVK